MLRSVVPFITAVSGSSLSHKNSGDLGREGCVSGGNIFQTFFPALWKKPFPGEPDSVFFYVIYRGQIKLAAF